VKIVYGMILLLALSGGMLSFAEDAKEGDDNKKEVVAVGKRKATITADKIEFDNKEGVILFDKNVLVDDEQFIMRSDRLIVFMAGTNDVDQIMAIGHVSLTNENRSAKCDKAVYTRKDSQIVLTGNAVLEQGGDKAGAVSGPQIAIWLDDEKIEVRGGGKVTLPPDTFKSVDKKLVP